MDFYARQAAARGQTRWLVFAFMAALLAVAVALDLVLFSFFTSAAADRPLIAPLDFAARNPGSALLCTLIIMGVLGLASLYKSMELRGGGGVVASALGGVRVERDTGDLKLKRLHNVVEEMAIASGVPMPEIYVLEQEPAINAFAAGHTPANAAVAVTQGALDRLNRDQLQGVIAHEFSHILNGDMRLNVQLMGWLFGLFVIALIGRTIFDLSPRDRRSSNGLAAVAFAVMVLGYVGLFLGRILQAAVSRQRERLADASGVQFTRNPQGLRDALVKIAAVPDGSRLNSPNAEQAAHMFFAEGLSRVFATHPPILERIRELDPQFDERELARVAAEPDQEPSLAEFAGKGAAALRGGPSAPSPAALSPGAAYGAPTATATVTAAAAPAFASMPESKAEQVAAQVGRPDAIHIAQAQAMRLALPESLREFTEGAGKAQALVLALLLSRDQAVRERQLVLLGKSIGPANLAAIEQVIPLADGLAPMLRLPALQHIFPALRRSSAAQRRTLAQLASDLIHADARIDVFEFCLAKLLETLLNDQLEARAPHGTLSLEDSQNEIAVLFATLAQLGAQDERAARMAYEAGMSTVLPMRRPEYAASEDWPRRLSDALPRLERLHPFAKKAVIEGLVKTIATDDIVTAAEAELLRTVCALLHCPLPPIVPDVG
jgi:Zn-dependent protease with chaperone function